MRKVLLLVALAGCAFSVNAQTVPSPQQTDQIILDPNGNGKADPGDKIRYKVTIQNTGAANATGVKVNAQPDPRTTLDLASFRTSPLAMPDAYACLGNVGITVPDGASDLLANDYDDAPAGLTATVGTFSTTQGGSITIAADGSFSYNPPRGYEGTDTYQYTLNDGNAVAGVTATDLGTITFTVSGLIWFINNNAGACASSCDGRMSNPYTSLAAFNTANDGLGLNPADNDNIFLYESATTYSGGIVLRNGQKLFGQDATATLAALTGLTPPTFSNALPATNSASPFASITNASGDGVTLADGNTLRGFRVGNCSDFGIENSGTTSVGNLIVSEVRINNTTGGGFDASHGSGTSMNAVFDAITSSGGTNGINLSNCAGTFTVNGGTIVDPTGTGVLISGGTVVFSSSGAITDISGFAVDVDNHDSGNVTFSGNITSTASGIRVQNCGGGTKTFSGSSKSLTTSANAAVTLTNNTGATINITGNGLVINTTSGTGFNATGGGTVSVQGSGNTISSTTGTALNVVSTTIGASGLTFQSISSSGGSATGIILDNTGSSGGLTVTGDGVNTSVGGNSTGGTIANKSGSDAATTTGCGIYLNNTRDVVLRRMTINGVNQNFGILGFAVTNFTLEYATVGAPSPTSAASVASHTQGTSTSGSGEGAIYFGNDNAGQIGLSGTASITNCQISAGRYDNMRVTNSGGTLDRLTITGTTFGLNSAALPGTANAALTVMARRPTSGNTVLNSTVTGCTFSGSPGNAANFTGQEPTTSLGVSTDIIFQNNTITNNHANNNIGGCNLTIAGFSNTTFNASNNTMSGANGSAITLQLGAPVGGSTVATSMDGTLNNNTIGTGTAGSGSASGNGIFFSFADNATAPKGQVTLAVTNNTIRNYNGNAGIYADNTGGSYNLDVTITGNTTSGPGAGAFAGLALAAGSPTSADDIDVCASVTGNNFSAGDPANANDIIMGGGASGLSSIRLPGITLSGTEANRQAQVQAFLLSNNNVAGTVASAYVDAPATFVTTFVAGAGCATPTH
ncbi:MAG: Ig-like domain-containing protein [Saprospiraceae bacterium]